MGKLHFRDFVIFYFENSEIQIEILQTIFFRYFAKTRNSDPDFAPLPNFARVLCQFTSFALLYLWWVKVSLVQEVIFSSNLRIYALFPILGDL